MEHRQWKVGIVNRLIIGWRHITTTTTASQRMLDFKSVSHLAVCAINIVTYTWYLVVA
jgi:hypothetical protein